MGWIMPTDRKRHPCRLPDPNGHLRGEMWRCEVCDDLWVVSGSILGICFVQVEDWWTRWLYRKEGYGPVDQD